MVVRNKNEVLTRCCSYPRLTLDFHTNKRIIDEVVRNTCFISEIIY